MIRYDEALLRIRAELKPLPPGERPPLRALGCHLAAPLVAPFPLPPCDDAAMDGFAIRAAATASASRATPVRLRPAEAIPISTGDPVPASMDAVVPLEWVRQEADAVAVLLPVEAGANVRRRGEDVEAGEEVAPAGMQVDTGVVLAAASLGIERLLVVPPVRVAVLPVGHHLAAGRPDATGPAVVAALRARGAVARLLPPATGDAAEVAARLGAALRHADWLITAGAASVGASDVVPAAVERLGARLLFHGVAIKPGKPIGVALHEGRPLLLLPGSPTAALAGLEGIGWEVLARLAGAPTAIAPLPATLGAALRRRRGKTGLLRGRASLEAGRLVFRPAAKQGPAQIRAVVGTNALAVLGPDEETLAPGDPVEVLLLPGAPGGDGPAWQRRTVAVCGWSGAGKTWVVEQLVARLAAAGLLVATVKHDGCGGELQEPGKDTARHLAAGAFAATLTGSRGTLQVGSAPRELGTLAAAHLAAGADVVLAEGFKGAPGVAKVEVAARGRARVEAAPLLALVSDDPAVEALRPDEAGMDQLAARLRSWLEAG